MKFREFEIKNYLGISTKRTPRKEECSDCQDIELREKEGDIVSAVNPTSFLTAPDFSSQGFTLITNLGFTTHVFSQLDNTTKEVIFYFQRGTVGGYSHIAVGMYPFYNDATGHWVNDWRWLNRLVVTTIIGASTYLYTLASYPSFYVSAQKVVYNITKNQWASIVAELGGGIFSLTVSGWAINDNVIVMDNYEPFGSSGAYYSAKSSIAAADLSFHRVLNELRVGFGSVINRLAIGIGYKKKYFQIDTVASSSPPYGTITDIDQVILDPYNIISDNGTFSFTASRASLTGSTTQQFPSAFGSAVWLRMTAVLDDFNEYLVSEYQQDDMFLFVGGTNRMLIKPTIRFATMNKRVTKIRFWLAGGAGTLNRAEDYKLIKEIDIAKSTAIGSGKAWTLDSTGTLILTNQAGIVESNSFEISYEDYVGETETQALRMTEALGYTATTQYASSWDQALIVGGATYLLNPYVDRTWKNFIFNSPISGAGASQYDVISAENYQSLDTKDGNDIVGIEVNSNMDFTILRNNGFQQYDPINQIPSQAINGIGCTSRLGIVNIDGTIFFPSQFDIHLLRGNNQQNISADSIRDVYRGYTKSDVIGVKDNYGSAVNFFFPTNHKFLTFIPDKGWIRRSLTTVVYFGSSYDGSIIFMDTSGNLYKLNPADTTHSATITLTWTSVPIDIALMGEGVKSDERFIVGSLWFKYASMKDITAQISYDGGNFGSDRTFAKTYSSGLVPPVYETKTLRFAPGHNCKSFQIKFSCTLASGDNRTNIAAMGINWQLFQTGLFR